ncbi:MAG TPA: hypothetical protein VE988_00800, partial [Gemmataceae bacterium]|nr:hypothetical protein [Gemmataceae bacterium]
MYKCMLFAALAALLAMASTLHAEPPRVQIDCASAVSCVAWSAKGDLLAAGSLDGTVRIFDAATGKEMKSWHAPNPVTAVAFSPDGKMLALGHAAPAASASIWNVQAGNLHKASTLKNYNPQYVAFSADGQAIAGVAVGKFFQMKITGAGMSGSSSVVPGGCCAMAPDGSICAWSDAKGLVRLRWCDPVKSTTMSVGRVQCLAFGPGGKWMATGGADNDVHLWDLASKQKKASLPGLPLPPTELAISADGHVVAALAADGTTIRVWDLIRNNSTRRQISHNRGAVGVLALSPDGKLLATTGLGGKALLIWNVATRDLTHKGPPLKLTAKELTDLWVDLSDKNYDKADAAWHKLAAGGDNSVAFLKEQIWPIAVPPMDMTKIDKWVTELDSVKFAVREKATKELMAAGEMAIVPLENVLKTPPSEEARLRAKLIMKQITQPVLTPERLRVLEVIELLEAMRTANAIAVLEAIGKEGRVTQIRGEA